MNQKSLFIGVGVTIVWFLGITIFCIWGNFGFEKNDLNSLGDFLAGIFAPVAFFWLILGYVQQGKQLDQNTKALEQQERALQLQIDEMKESVKQQTELVNIQRQQFTSINISVEPKLYIDLSDWELRIFTDINSREERKSYLLNLSIKNVGIGQARYIEIWHEKGGQIDFQLDTIENIYSNINKLDKDTTQNVSILLDLEELDFDCEAKLCTLEIRYQDIYKCDFKSLFDIDFHYENEDSLNGQVIAYPHF